MTLETSWASGAVCYFGRDDGFGSKYWQKWVYVQSTVTRPVSRSFTGLSRLTCGFETAARDAPCMLCLMNG